MPWPTNIPPDLRRALDECLSMRSITSADLWTEVREWLIKHGAEAPVLPSDAPQGRVSRAQRDQ